MGELAEFPIVRCFLLKVASRCNINCDYCYMYNHLDQSWKQQPKFMSDDVLKEVASRIREYTLLHKLDKIVIVYHGGEPLLIGTKVLCDHANLLRLLLPDVEVEFSMQTNGTLLTEDDIQMLSAHNIQISLSLDGPLSAHDKHRLDHSGKSTFLLVEQALQLLNKYPTIFSGVIAVIDPQNDPKEVMDYFGNLPIPQLDFLLPDANYLSPPIGKDSDEDCYKRWLEKCFDIWFDQYPNLKIRTFDSILAALLGAPSETDGFGFGDVSLITIETDGTYHDLDVLKITGAGTGLNGSSVRTVSIDEALRAQQIQHHRKLLTREGLSEKCQECSVVDVCGGGSVPHRYAEDGYGHPSIYCDELMHLIKHASKRAIGQINDEVSSGAISESFITPEVLFEFENVVGRSESFDTILNRFKDCQNQKFDKVLATIGGGGSAAVSALPEEELKYLAIQPSVVAWSELLYKKHANITIHAIDGMPIDVEPSYVNEIPKLIDLNWPRLQREDVWLRAPFGKTILFEDAATSARGHSVLTDALRLIAEWKSSILEEMKAISPEIQFIRDPTAHPDKIVSFSDNSVPGALYVQLCTQNGFVDACDLADSIIHEHRHQKLYLLQRVCPIVHADFPLVRSPWREELRPPTGLFHALYVFVMLLDFWNYLRENIAYGYTNRASSECKRIENQLAAGFNVVEACDLTDMGRSLLGILKNRYISLNL